MGGGMYINEQLYRKFSSVPITKERVEEIELALKAWVKKEDSWIVPQFLKETQMGWSYLQYFLAHSPSLTNTFDVVVATLVDRWIKYAFNQKNLSQHMQKILLKYLKVYDNHAFSVDLAAKKDLLNEEIKATNNYKEENYANASLEGFYNHVYAENVDKSRGGA